jgi:hypothetical protein
LGVGAGKEESAPGRLEDVRDDPAGLGTEAEGVGVLGRGGEGPLMNWAIHHGKLGMERVDLRGGTADQPEGTTEAGRESDRPVQAF